MKNSEAFEIEVSALLDGELVHNEVLDVIDQLVECTDLRAFYRQARSLGGVLEEGGVASGSGQLPPGLWQRIEASAAAEGNESTVIDARSRFRRTSRWLLASAAAVVFALAGWIASPSLQSAANSAPEVVNVRLAADAGQMTDERFVELTAELLRADRRYHVVMEEIIAAVNEGPMEIEGGREGNAPLSDDHGGFQRAAFNDVESGNARQRVWN